MATHEETVKAIIEQASRLGVEISRLNSGRDELAHQLEGASIIDGRQEERISEAEAGSTRWQEECVRLQEEMRAKVAQLEAQRNALQQEVFRQIVRADHLDELNLEAHKELVIEKRRIEMLRSDLSKGHAAYVEKLKLNDNDAVEQARGAADALGVELSKTKAELAEALAKLAQREADLDESTNELNVCMARNGEQDRIICGLMDEKKQSDERVRIAEAIASKSKTAVEAMRASQLAAGERDYGWMERAEKAEALVRNLQPAFRSSIDEYERNSREQRGVTQ